MNPADSSVLYATTYATATAKSGILKSVDAGNTWKNDASSSRVFSRLWVDLTASLVRDPANSTTLYAGSSAGVFKSLDLGKTWMVVSAAFPTAGRRRVLFDPFSPNVVYAEAELKGLFKSTDTGRSWKPINSGLPDISVRGLAIDPTDSQILYVGTFKRGVFKSTNGGESWQPTGTKE